MPLSPPLKVRRHFPDLPPLLDLERNQSLALVNSHFSVDMTLPLLPSQVQIGAIHCQPAKPLPQVSLGCGCVCLGLGVDACGRLFSWLVGETIQKLHGFVFYFYYFFYLYSFSSFLRQLR